MKKKWSVISIGNNLFWLLLFLGIALFAITFNLKVGWFLLYFFSLLLGCALLSIRGRFSHYQLRSDPSIIYNQGSHDTVKLQLIAKNGRHLRLLPRLISVIEFPDAQFELQQELTDGGKRIDLLAQLGELERGYYTTARVRLISKDVFNLFRKSYYFPVTSEIMVMPTVDLVGSQEAVSLLSRLKIVPLAANFIKSQDVKALRDYREGDPFNQIDWKLSAKRDMLIVKEFENDHQEALVLLFYGNEGHFYEEMLALFYSLELYESHQLGSPVCLMYDEQKELFNEPSLALYTASQPIHMEKELIRGIRRANFNQKRVVILAGRYSKDLIAISEELSAVNDVVVLYLNRKAEMTYEVFKH